MWCIVVLLGGLCHMSSKVRFSVSLDPKTNQAIEELAQRHKPELSKSYIVEYALLRLLKAMDAKQLLLPLEFEGGHDAERRAHRSP